MRFVVACLLLAAAAASADTMTLVREEQIQEGATADGRIDVWVGDGVVVSPTAWGGPDPEFPVYGESWVYITATIELRTFGQEREGWITIASSGGTTSSGGSNPTPSAGVSIGGYGGESLLSGTFPFQLGRPFTVNAYARASGTPLYSMITYAWVDALIYEADGTTPVPVYWADAVPTPEPGSLALVLLAAVAYQGFVFFVRQPMPSRLRK